MAEAVERAPWPTVVVDWSSQVVDANPAARRSFEVADRPLVGSPWRTLVPGLATIVVDGPPVAIELGRGHGASALVVAAWSVSEAFDLVQFVGHPAAAAPVHLGRDAFERSVASAFGSGAVRRPHWVVAVDVDRLRLIKDVAGAAAADAVVRAVESACLALADPGAVVGRLDDGSCVLTTARADRADTARLARAIATRVRTIEVPLPGHDPIRPSATVGVAPISIDEVADRTPRAAVVAALDGALADLSAHKPGRRTSPPMFGGSLAMVWAERFTHEMDSGRFELWEQPIVSSADGTRVGHEILIRAVDAQGAVVPAGTFVPVAEELGLVGLLDRWVLERGAVYRSLCDGVVRASVNLSPATLVAPEAVDQVVDWVHRSGLRPADLTLEITEQAALDPEILVARCTQLVGVGFEVSIDDFGTGFASHGRLVDLPCSEVKIAGSLASRAATDPTVRATIEGMVRSARAAGVRIVAEGIEDPHQLAAVRALGVDRVQGFYVGRPRRIGDPVPSAASGGIGRSLG